MELRKRITKEVEVYQQVFMFLDNLCENNRSFRFSISNTDENNYRVKHDSISQNIGIEYIDFSIKEFKEFIYIKLHNDTTILECIPDIIDKYEINSNIEKVLNEMFDEFIIDKLRRKLYEISDDINISKD